MSRLRSRHKGPHPLEIAKMYLNCEEDPDWCDTRFIDEYIGSGLFVTKDIEKGHFIVKYPGPLIALDEALKREKLYAQQGKGSFMYFFKYQSANYW